MKKNYISPMTDIGEAADVISTSYQVETEKISFYNENKTDGEALITVTSEESFNL